MNPADLHARVQEFITDSLAKPSIDNYFLSVLVVNLKAACACV